MGGLAMVSGATAFLWRAGLLHKTSRNHFCVKASLPDLPNLAKTARISLTPQQADEFAPKIQQVVDWFGQLQAIDLGSIEPSIRADTQGYNSREDLPQVFENRWKEVMLHKEFTDPDN
ncbi:hypothetical protein V2J09_003979 [Rumex salicifolius]